MSAMEAALNDILVAVVGVGAAGIFALMGVAGHHR
jgi:hypothetical protein